VAPIEFKAPWSRTLRITTIVLTIALCGFSVAGFAIGLNRSSVWQQALAVLPLIGIALAAVFLVRGYTLTEQQVEVKRLFWRSRLPIAPLTSIDGNTEAMRRTIAIAGNRGFFSYSGIFWSRAIGIFRALATDPSRAVVLQYPKRKVVVTPHDPQQLIMRVRTLLKTRDFPQ